MAAAIKSKRFERSMRSSSKLLSLACIMVLGVSLLLVYSRQLESTEINTIHESLDISHPNPPVPSPDTDPMSMIQRVPNVHNAANHWKQTARHPSHHHHQQLRQQRDTPKIEDEDEMFAIDNPLCKVLFPPSMQLLVHHKTGTILARRFLRILKAFCKMRKSGKPVWDKLKWLNFRDSPESLTDGAGNIKIHFWRDPVLTIISAFHYHRKSNEAWTSHPFSMKLFRNAAKYFDHSTDPQRVYEIYKVTTWTYDVDKEPPIWRFRYNDRQIEGT